MSYNRYPLSSPSGKAIPLDILAPISHQVINVTTSSLGSPVQITTQAVDTIMAILWSPVDVTISFDELTPVSDIDAGDLFIPANTRVQTVLNSQYLSAISSSSGKLHINLITLWDILATELQQSIG